MGRWEVCVHEILVWCQDYNIHPLWKLEVWTDGTSWIMLRLLLITYKDRYIILDCNGSLRRFKLILTQRDCCIPVCAESLLRGTQYKLVRKPLVYLLHNQNLFLSAFCMFCAFMEQVYWMMCHGINQNLWQNIRITTESSVICEACMEGVSGYDLDSHFVQ
jgi:hypothetical protein